jgi:hypothetical protein
MICESGKPIEQYAPISITIENVSGISGIGNLSNPSFVSIISNTLPSSLKQSIIDVKTGIILGSFWVNGNGFARGKYYTPILATAYNLKSESCQRIGDSPIVKVTYTGFASGWGGYRTGTFASGIVKTTREIYSTGENCNFTLDCAEGYVYNASGILPVSGRFIVTYPSPPDSGLLVTGFGQTGFNGFYRYTYLQEGVWPNYEKVNSQDGYTYQIQYTENWLKPLYQNFPAGMSGYILIKHSNGATGYFINNNLIGSNWTGCSYNGINLGSGTIGYTEYQENTIPPPFYTSINFSPVLITNLKGGVSGNIFVFMSCYDMFGIQTGCRYIPMTPFGLFTGGTLLYQVPKESAITSGCRIPVISRGRNIDTENITNPSIRTSTSGVSNDWREERQKKIISGTNLYPTGKHDAAVVDKLLFEPYSVVNVNKWPNVGYSALDIITVPPETTGKYYDKWSGYTTTGDAWASYNVSAGMNSKVVNAWNISILSYQTGFTSGSFPPKVVWMAKTIPKEFIDLPIIPGFTESMFPPNSGEGEDIAFKSVSIFTEGCLGKIATTAKASSQGKFCGDGGAGGGDGDSEEEETEPSGNPTCEDFAYRMWSGAVLYGDCGYFMDGGEGGEAIAEAEKQKKNKLPSDFSPLNCALNSGDINEAIYSSIYTGIIYYNHPQTGDGIYFNSYHYDYFGAYKNRYGVEPTIDPVEFNFVYPDDFTTIDGLVTLINENLSSESHKIWYPLLGSVSDTSGWYFDGPLMTANKINDNEIKIWSLRVGPIGYYDVRTITGERVTTAQYMLPNKICLQGSNDNTAWADINCQDEIPWSQALKITRNESFTIATSGNLTSGTVIPPDECPPEDLENAISTKIGEALMGICSDPAIAALVSKDDFATLVCHPPEDPSKPPCTSGTADSTGISGNLAKIYLLTGYKGSRYPINPTDGRTPDFVNTTAYNYYRVLLSDFNESTVGIFRVSSINLFYENDITMPTIFTGKSVPIFNADYSGKLFGFATGLISGIDNIELKTDGSGHIANYRFALPSGWTAITGGAANPTKPTGYPYFVGYLDNWAVGVKCLSQTYTGYFYNPETNMTSINLTLGGCITGTGSMTGIGYKLTDDAVAILLASNLGGEIETFTSGAIAKGIIEDATINSSKLRGTGLRTGIVSGTILDGSGSLSFNELLTGTGIYPVYFILPTGSIQSTGYIDYNYPTEFDGVTINDTSIYYSTNTYDDGYFYSDITGLNNIINTVLTSYVTGVVVGQRINLTAKTIGDAGNTITLSGFFSTGGPIVSTPTLTGGVSIYSELVPSGIFSGYLNQIFINTGVYTGIGTGILTGEVSVFSGERTFTGVWNLKTGETTLREWLVDYQKTGYIRSGTGYYHTGTYFGTDPGIFKAIVGYKNEPFLNSTLDIVDLKAYDSVGNTGITFRISGVG